MAALTHQEQHIASKLYLSGLSAQEVANKLDISLNATFYALRKQHTTMRTSAESNLLRFNAQPLSYTLKENLSRADEDLRLSAIMLYWAEGYKVGKGSVDFANSDPDMALLFRRFLSEICGVRESKLRCALYCYEGQNIPEIRAFWSTLLTIPENQFIKPYIRKKDMGVRGPRMLHGLVHVRYYDTKLLQQILRWIDQYR
jgi:predicted DNA-binding protein YlxM (UPF0122 family)